MDGMNGWRKETWRSLAGEESSTDYIRGDFRITSAIEPCQQTGRFVRRWILLYRGFQQGGNVDASGAGDASYATVTDAAAAARRHRDY